MTTAIEQAKAYVARHTSYDVETIEIDADGEVTAMLDPDKRPGLSNEQRDARYLVGHVDDMQAQAAE